MKILIIDNYDSFTFNLYQYIGEMVQRKSQKLFDQPDIQVYRNDQITVAEIEKLGIDRVIISPGPGTPKDKEYFGVCSEVIVEIGKEIPILGVCLGMQGIAHCYGGDIVRAKLPMHGKVSSLVHDEKGVFNGLPQGLEVMRYHSLIVAPESIPDCLEITSVVSPSGIETTDLQLLINQGSEIMGIRHKEYMIEGIQFHPESFATEGSLNMLENFIFSDC